MLASFAAVVGLSLVAVPTAATAADQTLVRTAVADTYVLWSSPTSSFGRVGPEDLPDQFPRLRRLRLWPPGGQHRDVGLPPAVCPPCAGLRGIALHPATGSWSESTTWADRPAWDNTVIATSPTRRTGAWVDVPLPVDAMTDAGPVSWASPTASPGSSPGSQVPRTLRTRAS